MRSHANTAILLGLALAGATFTGPAPASLMTFKNVYRQRLDIPPMDLAQPVNQEPSRPASRSAPPFWLLTCIRQRPSHRALRAGRWVAPRSAMNRR